MKARHFTIASSVRPNRWDGLAFFLILGLFALAADAIYGMREPLAALENSPISLNPVRLPGYALRTVLRMLAAMSISLLFTFAYATLAAKNKRAGMVLVPLLDVLQSVPVLGFISFTVVFFMHLFPGNVMGAECASIFAIFSSQAWNMTYSVYQSLRTVPRDLEEVSRAFRFSAWQRFCRLEVPFATPSLIWNMMASMSGGWFFVVASEAVTVGNNTFILPGIGSYVAQAIAQQNLHAIGWAILTMFVVILIYDQLLFRPLVIWSEKFRADLSSGEAHSQSWVLRMFGRVNAIRLLFRPLSRLAELLTHTRLPSLPPPRPPESKSLVRIVDLAWYTLLTVLASWAILELTLYISITLVPNDLWIAFKLGFYTLLRVCILIVLASLLWVPIGVWVGLRPSLATRIQPLAQFFAAFPANILFPVFVVVIVRFRLEPDIWLSPLIVLGTQWYILFNVIAGTMALPLDLREAAATFHIRGWQWWKTLILPGIFPYYITGAITAVGGSWNASIVAEIVNWGHTTLTAQGLGSYIAIATTKGDYPRIVLGIAVMVFFVILFNRLVWHRLYTFAERRLRLD